MDDLWYSEYHTPNVRFSIKVTSQLHFEKSDYQTIGVFDSPEFGRFLTLDGIMMLTEKDEFIYHEMITHPAFAVCPGISRVLVIGAGDGGVARELAKYPQIRQIDIVEIDERVVEVSRKFLPQTACGFSDSRVTLFFADGLKFVRRKENEYDLIIVDSTDPFGPGEVLFTREFYGNCYRALTEKGILINQHESPSMRGTLRKCARPTNGSAGFSPSAGCIRPTFLPILRAIGSLALPARAWTLWRTSRRAGGSFCAFPPATIIPSCIGALSIFPIM